MEEKPPQNKISQLLERLQEESWQLELLISGFAIFLVGSVYEPLRELSMNAEVIARGLTNNGIAQIPLLILKGSWFFLLINLVMHVILRGFWIAAIGLRYISGDIDLESLRLAPKFDQFLNKRLPSFDLFIERLEKICSVVFAFTFLIIFVIISIGVFIGAIMFINYLINLGTGYLSAENVMKVQMTVVGTIFFSGFIYFIDFVTLGWVKRIKWFSNFYYPIYRVFSVLTLSFLYRPLYYNLIDNKFGRKVGFLIVPYIFGILFLSSAETKAFLFVPTGTNHVTLKSDHYVEHLEKYETIGKMSIPSKHVQSNYLELFIPYFSRNDDEIKFLCPELIPDKTLGTKFSMIKFGSGNEIASNPDSMLLCVSNLYQIYIDDSLYQDLDFMFYQHPNAGEQGLLSMIDINALNRGRHDISVQVAAIDQKADSIFYNFRGSFPFWKE